MTLDFNGTELTEKKMEKLIANLEELHEKDEAKFAGHLLFFMADVFKQSINELQNGEGDPQNPLGSLALLVAKNVAIACATSADEFPSQLFEAECEDDQKTILKICMDLAQFCEGGLGVMKDKGKYFSELATKVLEEDQALQNQLAENEPPTKKKTNKKQKE